MTQQQLDYNCFQHLSVKGKHICQNTEFIADFQVKENYVQDMFLYNTKKNVIKDKTLIDKTLEFTGTNKHQNMIWPKFPMFGEEPKGFDDLFKITFTLNPQK